MTLQTLPEKLQFFVNPVPLAAVMLMALNDHWMKLQFGNAITGKLSDFCGVFYFPIFILALAMAFDEILLSGKLKLSPRKALASIVVTDLLMLTVKLSPTSAQWIENFFRVFLFEIQLIPDSTDLISLIMNPLTYFYLKSYWSSNSKVT